MSISMFKNRQTRGQYGEDDCKVLPDVARASNTTDVAVAVS